MLHCGGIWLGFLAQCRCVHSTRAAAACGRACRLRECHRSCNVHAVLCLHGLSSRFCDARQLVEMSMGCCSLALCMSGTGINYCVRGTFDKYCLFCLVSGAVCASCFKWSKSVISKADVMVHKLHLEQLHWWHLHYWSGSRLYCSRLIFVMWVISCIQNCVYLFVCDCPSCIALILLALLFCFCMLPYHFASTMLRLIPAQSS